MSSVAEAVARARSLCAADEDAAALTLAREVAARIDPDHDADAGWDLADLFMELGDNDAGVELAARLGDSATVPEAALRHVAILVGAGEEEAAATVLRAAVARHGATAELVGPLIERVLAGVGWGVLDDLPAFPAQVTAMVDDVRQRAAGLDLRQMDSRRTAYVLAQVVVLGGSEDEGGMVAPYWFFNVDEHEAAWFLRRLLAWLEIEGYRPSAVHTTDAAVRPVALALASRLGVPCADVPGALVLHGGVDRLDGVEADERMTVCLGVTQPPDWSSLLRAPTVDVVGVFASVELSWSDEDAPVPASDEELARRIEAELARLPRDRGLQALATFYRRHRSRLRGRA